MPHRYPRIDAWPQYWNFGIDETGIWTATEVAVPVPRPIFTLGGGMDSAVIIEILHIILDWEIGAPKHEAGFKSSICTRSRDQQTDKVAVLNDGECIHRFKYMEFTATPGTAYEKGFTRNHTYDYTDDEGRGLLVAVDNLYLQVHGFQPNNAAAKLYYKALYRFVRVPLREYIGIVQSQQT